MKNTLLFLGSGSSKYVFFSLHLFRMSCCNRNIRSFDKKNCHLDVFFSVCFC